MTKTIALGCLLTLVSASFAWGNAESYRLEGEHTGRGPYHGRLTLDELEGQVRVDRQVTFADGSTLSLQGVGARRGDEVRATFSFVEQAGLSTALQGVQQGPPAATRSGRLRVQLDPDRSGCRSELRFDDGARATDVGSEAELAERRADGEASLPVEEVLGEAPVERGQDGPPPAPEAPAFAFGEGHALCLLDSPEVHESSGIACSRVADGRWWTHNDSGDAPRLFAFDRAGATRAFDVTGAEAVDWEDLCSFEQGGEGWLVIGDTGNNKSKRKSVTLYLVEEPRSLEGTTSLAVARRLEVRYEDGRHDCEGIAVDPVAGQLLLVTKVRKGQARPAVYSVPLAALRAGDEAVARKLADLPAPVPQLTTSLDVSPDGLRLVVLSYGDAYGWTRSQGEGWAAALARDPVRIALPGRGQGEALCFGRDGRALHLTSEGQPCQVWELPPR